MNFLQMFKTLKNNPQQAIVQMIGNNNPMINNLVEMAKKGDKQGIEKVARNMCNERGLDFDKEYSNFMNNFK